MRHELKVIFGKEQVLKINLNEALTEEERKLFVKEYQFNSEEEKQAFQKGLEEAVGWSEFCISD